MHQIVTRQIDSSRRWWVLAIVVAAQFMFGVDAFVVNVAIPTIAVELQATPAQIESVIAIYLIAYATLVVTGGRLGDIHGTRNVFMAGVLGFTLTSLWCGLAQSGVELIIARLAQGATAALMVPQVLATLHLLFTDETRSRAFAIYGIVLGLAGAAGFLLGGLLITIDLAGTGWRSVFFINVPCGLVIAAAAWRIMPSVPRRSGTRLDIRGSMVLFAGLLCLIGPLLFGHDVGWAPWLWAVMAAGGVILAAFLKLEHTVARAGGMPLIDLTLLADAAFLRGLGAAFFFFFANLSFYLVMTLYHAAWARNPSALSRHGLHSACTRFRRGVTSQRRAGAPSRHQGLDRRLRATDRGSCCAGARRVFCRCAVAAPARAHHDHLRLRSGIGDGATLRRGAVKREACRRGLGLRDVRHHCADRKCGRGGRNRRGVLRRRSLAISARRISRFACAVCDINHGLRRIPGVDAPRLCTKLRHLWLMPIGFPGKSLRFRRIDSARSFYFAMQQLSGLAGR